MSGYRGRLNVNVSHFLADLNTIPSSEEQAVDNFNPDDLSLFTNTFFDFVDMGEPLAGDFSSNDSFNGPTQKTESKQETLQKQHFEVHNSIDSFLAPTPLLPFAHETTFSLPPSIPAPATQTQPSTPATATFPMNTTPTGAKRKGSIMESASPESLEDASRFAAEEDKRRRNTAASARFRIKKKQREQALEKSAKDMADKVSQLEMKINQLEMENKWLKNLITEKNSGKKDNGLDISELFNAKFSAAASAALKEGLRSEAKP
ncbi:hypothetical protein L211DRAFT_855494 [Terfezia boudieri ATCC MYA-4762]|uniref:BZIP domain-containing protein n=1 Tax=Terfezia boudieri ATCC MYA-4762 TaxID=1051890 RepID=A0A3N4M3W9_9PEZI|nr:hypothetical protein L211DRAFT_855494 [Terfezia boudieri ATCC MYA-4762]